MRRGLKPEFRRKPLAYWVGVALLSLSPAAQPNPGGPRVVHGAVSFTQTPSTLSVTNSPGAIINWQSFSIGTSETTRFLQQSATSAVMNRVVGVDPSSILGTLSSNGRVFLVNPSGIVFGAGARIDVAGLVASTLNLSDADFLAGKLNFEAGAVASPLVNHGAITTPAGGRVYLIAPDVQNHGVITSPQGQVILAAGRKVSLVEPDLPSLRVEIEAGGEALNVGRIITDGGKAGVYAGLIDQRGLVRADTVARGEQGQIVFRASKNITLAHGSITSASGVPGGEHDGGEVRIVAGDTLEMHAGSLVRVDGGIDGGDGGFLELSGHDVIRLNGTYSGQALARGFRGGALLLDPADTDITTNTSDSACGVTITCLNPTTYFNGTGFADVTVDTTNNLRVLSAIANADVNNGIAGGSLTLNAGNNLSLQAPIGSVGTPFDHDLNLSAGSSLSIDAVVNVGARTAMLSSTGSVSQTQPITAGALELRGAGGVHTLTNAGNQVGEVKMNTGSVLLTNSGATTINGIPTPGAGTEAFVVPATPMALERHGSAIAVDGDVMVVGAPGTFMSGQGAAYVYRWNGSSWVFETRLTAAGTINFGQAVAVQGNHIVIGAPETTDGGVFRSGAAYAYEWNGSTWGSSTKLPFSQRVFESVFGTAVSIDSDRLVVGGLGRTSEGGSWTGKVWFYDFAGGAWVERGNARQSDPQSNDYFGSYLDISGNRMIVGAWNTNSVTGGTGKAYVFEFNPATRLWAQTQKLTQTGGSASDNFGQTVSISGDIAVIGAPTSDPGGKTNAGALYVFRYNGASWAQQQVLTPADLAASDLFGLGAQVRDGVIAAAASRQDLPGKGDAGAAYLFRNNGTQWVQDTKISASNGVSSDLFGSAVALNNQRTFIGALGADPGGASAAGASYVYDPVTASVLSGSLTVNSTGALTQSVPVTAGGAVNYSGSSIAIDGALNAGTNAVTLSTSGAGSQSAPITASSLLLLGAGGSYAFTNAGNSVTTLAANTGSLSFVNNGSLIIGSVGATSGIAATGNVTVDAQGAAANATVAADIGSTGSNSLLRLSAGNDVNVNAPIGAESQRFDHDITLQAGNNVNVSSSIYQGNRTLTLAANVTSLDAVNTGSGNVIITPATAPVVVDTLGNMYVSGVDFNVLGANNSTATVNTGGSLKVGLDAADPATAALTGNMRVQGGPLSVSPWWSRDASATVQANAIKVNAGGGITIAGGDSVAARASSDGGDGTAISNAILSATTTVNLTGTSLTVRGGNSAVARARGSYTATVEANATLKSTGGSIILDVSGPIAISGGDSAMASAYGVADVAGNAAKVLADALVEAATDITIPAATSLTVRGGGTAIALAEDGGPHVARIDVNGKMIAGGTLDATVSSAIDIDGGDSARAQPSVFTRAAGNRQAAVNADALVKATSGSLILRAGSLTVRGGNSSWASASDIGENTATVNANATLSANDMTLTVSGPVEIAGGGQASASASYGSSGVTTRNNATVNAKALVRSANDLSLTVTGGSLRVAGGDSAGASASEAYGVSRATANADAELSAGRSVTVSVTGGGISVRGGQFASVSASASSANADGAAAVSATGKIAAGNDLALSASGSISVRGGDGARADASGTGGAPVMAAKTSVDGIVSAGGALALSGGSLAVQGGNGANASASDSGRNTATVNARGMLVSTGPMTLNASGALAVDGGDNAAASTVFGAAGGRNEATIDAGGLISAGGLLTINAGSFAINGGTQASFDSARATGGGSNFATTLANAAIVAAAGLSYTGGAVTLQGGTARTQGGAGTNTAVSEAGASILVTGAKTLDVSGTLDVIGGAALDDPLVPNLGAASASALLDPGALTATISGDVDVYGGTVTGNGSASAGIVSAGPMWLTIGGASGLTLTGGSAGPVSTGLSEDPSALISMTYMGGGSTIIVPDASMHSAFIRTLSGIAPPPQPSPSPEAPAGTTLQVPPDVVVGTEDSRSPLFDLRLLAPPAEEGGGGEDPKRKKALSCT